MTIKRDPSKFLQLGFVGLLVISFAQASYWIYDHVSQTQTVRTNLRTLYEAEADTIAAFYSGAGIETAARLLPHIEIDTNSQTAAVREAALAYVIASFCYSLISIGN